MDLREHILVGGLQYCNCMATTCHSGMINGYGMSASSRLRRPITPRTRLSIVALRPC